MYFSSGNYSRPRRIVSGEVGIRPRSVTITTMRFRLYAILVTSCLLGACSSMPTLVPAVPAPDSRVAALQDCAGWFQRLDAVIDQSGVRDAEAHRLPGYPHLRSDRLLASFADDVAKDRDKFPDWLSALRDLDQRSRDMEIRNLPAPAARALGVPDKASLRAKALQCGNALLAADVNSPHTLVPLTTASRVPDSYSSALRVLGLYPLVSIPFLDGVKRWQQRTIAEFERQRTIPFDSATTTRYVPALANPESADPRTLLARARRDALGIPRFPDADRDALLAAHAPIFEVDTASDDDRIGTMGWRQVGMLGVETARPTVYRRIAFTRVGKNVLPQLIYTAWFPRRTSSHILDPIAGEFDGVILRITLDNQGRPMFADSIHACGCYHLFFPGPRMTLRPAPETHNEWAFVPAPLPSLLPGARISLRVASGTHYVTRIETADSLEGTRYVTADDNSLRSLRISGDATRSIYGPDGLIAGSKRGERFLFWPMGIASAGAMRQWGGHATAFVGRRHFDDADLVDRHFAISGE